jgi:hypothetical protein
MAENHLSAWSGGSILAKEQAAVLLAREKAVRPRIMVSFFSEPLFSS